MAVIAEARSIHIIGLFVVAVTQEFGISLEQEASG
jgi:hypothetical protein